MGPDKEHFYYQDFSAEKALLNSVRANLVNPAKKISLPPGLKFEHDPTIANVYITLFQEGQRPIRWGSRRKSLAASLQRICQKLRENDRFADFSVRDPNQCRILFEIVIEEYPCDPHKLTTLELTPNRFEPGIHGLRFTYRNQLYYFMPTDAVINNLMTVKQVFNFLAKRTGVAKSTNSIKERVKILRSSITVPRLLKSFACINYDEKILPLYRGYPVPVKMNRNNIKQAIISSNDWLLNSMKDNGQFLYYYDPVKDSEVDFQHPGMTDPTYYNILRHSGGTISLLKTYELTREEKYLFSAKKSLDFLVTVLREHEFQDHYACYPFFNNKSKLGGAGVALVALVSFFRQSGDICFRKYMDGLVYHILSRVSDTGELIGYFIHPLVNNGQEILNPDEKLKKELFSFYYPGEALLGLALYLLHVPDISPELRQLILEKSRKALDFLIYERPIKYHYMFDPLPADGWLMQAIEEWVKVDGFAEKSYIDFVYNDAQAMIDHMYQEHDAPFFDYPGSFYYQYGEHAYPDGARCEGLVAAYHLARYLKDEQRADHFMNYLAKAARNLMYTYNTPESTYAHLHPAKSIGSFRFKMTRQWVRVDSVQHSACFFSRLLPCYPENKPGTIYGDAEMIARVTGGKWYNLETNRRFHGIRVNIERIEENDLCFTTTPEEWGNNIPDTQSKLAEISRHGAAAAVISDEKYAVDAPCPVLLVENSRAALEQLAFFCRDSLNHIKRVLITGTEGKTGFKFQLHYLLNKQTRAHATLDSSNLTVPILCSLASLNEKDQVEIIEASVAQPDVGVKRSIIARPHMCVVTEVGLQHLATHGSLKNLIENKASIIEGLQKDGICIVNADSGNYNPLREAMYQRKFIPIITFGSTSSCNGYLQHARFNNDTLFWEIEAIIEGKRISYSLPVLGEHAPLSSVSVLLAIHHLGYDINQAAADYSQFTSYETMGKLSRISYKDGSFIFYDHSHRGSLLGFQSALKDLSRLETREGGRKIAVIGNILNLGDFTRSVHEQLAGFIEEAGIERLYTVGDYMEYTVGKLNNTSIHYKHGVSWQKIQDEFLRDIQPHDLVFMKGHHRIWLTDLAAKVYQLGEVHEIR